MSDKKGDKKGAKRTTRSSTQNPDADNSGDQPDDAPQGLTSADLDFMPMRVYQRRRRAREVMERILAASPRFAVLPAAQQNRVREAIEESIRENILDFMRNSAPRTLYPYEDAVLNAVRMTIQWNPDICAYDVAEWQSGLPEQPEQPKQPEKPKKPEDGEQE
ncbi:hypothetical protein PG996_006166 [Apiospora saccharicola]|uniref:Uncharacterized protein n=1 Tax=Apiospora saccharicola TaxID=335842 RepID=A0ABR1VNP5_9PEZI